MPRYKLRTLLIVLAVLPPLLAAAWFVVVGLVREPSTNLNFGEVFFIVTGLAMAIALAIGLGCAVASIGNVVIGLWDDR